MRFILALAFSLVAGGAFADTPAPTAPLESLTVYPAAIALTGPRDVQHLGVLGHYAGGQAWDVHQTAKFTSSDPKIARVDGHGVVHPVADGSATVTIQLGTLTKQVPVTVKHAAADLPVAFTREVQPILIKSGCNQGACHGAQHGRGGFRLSLLGFDPIFDHAQIVESAEGRRIVVSDAERSILLQKPALLMEHGGGERLKVGSRDYLRIQRWLEDGAPSPTKTDADVVSIQVWPAKRIMVPGETQQLLVTATWRDGTVEDVTTTAQFDSLNDSVAGTTPGGLVGAKAVGETHIMVRFCGQATVAQVTLPYARLEKDPVFPANNFIDERLLAKWKDLGLLPSELCSDLDFIRRVYLDLIGTLPRPEEVKAFMDDKSPAKRSGLIDRVLERPEFVDFWAYKWGDLLRINRDQMNERGMWAFHNWIRASIRDKRPIDEMVRDIITAEGSTFTEGPANYFRVANTPADWAENTSQVFLGIRIACAKCHHHPFEKWSQDDYYGMAAFFVRLGTKNSQEFGLFGKEQVVYLKNVGEQTHPRKGGAVKPHPLDGADMDHPIDRRVMLADWVTKADNPHFARNIVNRFWGYVMGRGMVEPLDDMRATNPASNPELLDALAADFVKNKFDMRHLLRTILNSRAYQLSNVALPENKADVQNIHYTRFAIRRLTAEQLADAVDYVTGTQTKYPGLPLGTRAIQLPDTDVKSFFLDTFGRPPRQVTCECERSSQPNIAQALHLMNNVELNKRITDPKGRIEKLIAAKKSHEAMIQELYQVTLSRPALAEEVERAKNWISQAGNLKDGLQDVMWVLLNSREFSFNH